MSIQTGTYVGNGARQFIPLDFVPSVLFVKGAANLPMCLMKDGTWVGRTIAVGANESFNSALRVSSEKGFYVGQSNNANQSGVTFHYLALSASAQLGMAKASWFGNGASGNVIPVDPDITPIAALIKRDNPLAGVFRVAGAGNALLTSTGAALASSITSFGAGVVTLGTAENVNQLDGPAGVGEGIDGVFFGESPAVHAGIYVGDGTASRSVAVPFTPKAVLIQAPGLSLRLLTDTTSPSVLAAISSAGAVADNAQIEAGGFRLLSSALNATGAEIQYIAIAGHSDPITAAPAVRTKGRKAVYLPARGVNSYIACGTGNSVRKAGAHSVEWLGSVEWDDRARNKYGALIIRGGTTLELGDTVNSYNWGLTLSAPDDYALNWPGSQIGAIVADRYVLAGDIRKVWRTGILVQHNKATHWMVTHDGVGGWRMYRNGLLVKVRNLDMTATNLALANTMALTSRRTVIGNIDSNGSMDWSRAQRMSFMLARFYDRALAPDEVYARFERAALQSAIADVTSGLLEEWDAANASSASLPATINAENNGTISGGTVLTL